MFNETSALAPNVKEDGIVDSTHIKFEAYNAEGDHISFERKMPPGCKFVSKERNVEFHFPNGLTQSKMELSGKGGGVQMKLTYDVIEYKGYFCRIHTIFATVQKEWTLRPGQSQIIDPHEHDNICSGLCFDIFKSCFGSDL